MKAIDLFAGAGGFTEGAIEAGIEVMWAANHWPLAVEYHTANHPSTYHLCQDLHQADWSQVPAHDLLLASPACQGHSRARGTEMPHHDALRSTAWAIVKSFILILFLISLTGTPVVAMAGGIPLIGGNDFLDAHHVRACNAYLCLYDASWPEELCQSSFDLYFSLMDMVGDQEAQRWVDSCPDDRLADMWFLPEVYNAVMSETE